MLSMSSFRFFISLFSPNTPTAAHAAAHEPVAEIFSPALSSPAARYIDAAFPISRANHIADVAAVHHCFDERHSPPPFSRHAVRPPAFSPADAAFFLPPFSDIIFDVYYFLSLPATARPETDMVHSKQQDRLFVARHATISRRPIRRRTPPLRRHHTHMLPYHYASSRHAAMPLSLFRCERDAMPLSPLIMRARRRYAAHTARARRHAQQ